MKDADVLTSSEPGALRLHYKPLEIAGIISTPGYDRRRISIPKYLGGMLACWKPHYG